MVLHQSDDEIKTIRDTLWDGSAQVDGKLDKFTIVNDLVYYKDGSLEDEEDNQRLLVPQAQRKLLLQIAHDDQLYGGHLGVRKTQKKLKSYWWPGMTKDVAEYVQTCETCQ